MQVLTDSVGAADPGGSNDGRGAWRIGVVTAYPPSRGSLNEYGVHLVRALATNDRVSQVIVFGDEVVGAEGDGLPEPPAAPLGPEVEVVTAWRFNDPLNLLRLRRAVREAQIDGLLFNIQFATFGDRRIAGGLGLLAPALTRWLGVPTGVILHNLADNVDMRDAGFAANRATAAVMTMAGRLLTRAILRADYVAVTIPRYVDLLVERYRAGNVLLAPHGSFEQLPEPVRPHTRNGRSILAFGKWGTYKKVDDLIQAFELLEERGYGDLSLVIAGTDSPNSPGYLDQVRAGCDGNPRIRFTGYVAEADVAGLFSDATVVAFPYTSTTGSSGVVHQAGSYGCAMVLPAIGDFVELIEDEGFVGQYFEPADPGSLADALAALLDDEDQREAHGRRNFLAANGVPLDEVVDWHLLHLQRVGAERAAR